jgi:hypothetical protein
MQAPSFGENGDEGHRVTINMSHMVHMLDTALPWVHYDFSFKFA